jgi:hypothetical protein
VSKTFTFNSTTSLYIVANASSPTGYYAVGLSAANNFPCSKGDSVTVTAAATPTYTAYNLATTIADTGTNCDPATSNKNKTFCYQISVV